MPSDGSPDAFYRHPVTRSSAVGHPRWIAGLVALLVLACGGDAPPTDPGGGDGDEGDGAAPNQIPTARIAPDESAGSTPFRVRLDAGGSADPDGRIASYAWDFGDGAEGSGRVVEHTYDDVGMFVVTLTVRDDAGAEATALDSIFALAPRGPGDHTLEGGVWHDVDGDGARDGGEPPTAGMKVFLDADGDRRLDSGEMVTVTREDGSFVFEGLVGSKSYTVTQALTLGWSNTFPGLGGGGDPGGASGVDASPAARIVGGEEVEWDRFPFMVALLNASVRNDIEAFFCGGTLISGFWVLTAGHCVLGATTSDLEVMVGTGSLSQGAERIGVERVRITQAFRNEEGLDDDMALLRLERRVMLPRIRLAPAGRAQLLAQPGDTATAAGWGMTGNRPSDGISTQLRAVELPIIDAGRCKDLYDVQTARIVCAGREAGGRGTCFGDSGGPLLVPGAPGRWIQVGVTSFGLQCGESLPSAFTAVEPLLDFVVQNAEPELSGSHVVDWSGGSVVSVEFGNFR